MPEVQEDQDRDDASAVVSSCDDTEDTQSQLGHDHLSEHTMASCKQPNLTSLITNKISELEKDASRDEEEERDIAKAVKAEHRKLSSLVNETDTELGKVSLLQKKYSNLFSDMQRLEREHTRQKTKSERFAKEINVSKGELSKATNMKHKLETLCRELQKENKRVKEDSKRLAQLEQQKRLELNNKFETTIIEIKTKMDEDSGYIGKRRFEDNELKDKFKSFLEQYELRERHYSASIRAKELEVQLHQARADQARKTAESESLRAKSLHSQVSTFSETEAELRNQLNIYVEKFKQVEDTLNNSNDLFLNFRKEMETMTRKTKKLEKENALIRTKCDTANKNILEMAEERASYRKEIEALRQKSIKLENLCRALQSERAKHGIAANGNSAGPELAKPVIATGKKQAISADGMQQQPSTASDRSIESDESVDEIQSEPSFDLEPPYTGQPPSAPIPKSPREILGFLKVSPDEEAKIRKQQVQIVCKQVRDTNYFSRQDLGHETITLPEDKDKDGYLAVTSHEKQFISRLRGMKNTNTMESQSVGIAGSDGTDIAGKFSLFQKMFSSIPNLSIQQQDSSSRTAKLTQDEKRLYEEACARLASMSSKYANKVMSAEEVKRWETNLSQEGAELLFSAVTDPHIKNTDSHNKQLDAFKRQIPPEKLREFSQQYETMMQACTSLVQSPETLDQTYEALMTSMAILLSEGDLASLQSKWFQSQKARTARQEGKKT